MLALRAHTRQFLIGPQLVHVWPDWQGHIIAPGIVLSADSKLCVQKLQSADGLDYWLLGYTLLSDRREDLETAFASVHSDNVVDWTTSWAGRWLLLTAEFCVPDAWGSLGLFYRQVDESTWLSSSVSLLAHSLPSALTPGAIPWDATHERGIDWIPAPFSTREGILKLPPFRSISMRTGKLSALTMPSLNSPIAAPIDEMASRLLTIVENAANLPFSERDVHLTAGLDTRTILSAFVASGVSCQAITFTSPATPHADKQLPSRLAAAIGVPHRIVRRQNMARRAYDDRIRVIREHTDGQAVGTATDYVAYAQAQYSGDHIAAFGGLGFELGRCFFWKRLGGADPGGLVDRLTHDPLHPRWHQAISAWGASLKDHIPLQMDWRDRLYLEQRLGGWASANQQCSDMVGVRLHPANCAKLFQAMFQLGEPDRRSGTAQRELIRRLAPELARYPINPKSWSERAHIRARRVVSRLSKKFGRAADDR